MIQFFAGQHRKIAGLLFFVLYFELVLPSIASAMTPQNSICRLKSYPSTPLDASFRIPALTKKYIGQKGILNGKNDWNHETAIHLEKPVEQPNHTSIGGPGQPEMQSFQSVNSNNLVDLFTGDFSYNIPLMDVGGYPINIHFSSGISMDQDASWVGLGWNINPGTINRNMRGLPDDFNGKDSITKTQNIKENKTVGVSVAGGAEVKGTPIGLNANTGIFHNNYNGWGLDYGIGASINSGKNAYGPLTGSLSISNNSQSGLNIGGSIGFRLDQESNNQTGRVSIGSNYNSRAGISSLQLSAEYRTNKYTTQSQQRNGYQNSSSWDLVGMSFAIPSYTPSISMPYTSYNYSFTLKGGGEVYLVHPSLNFTGYVSKQYIDPVDQKQKLPAYGYLYFSDKGNNKRALLDFNREKELQFNEKSTPHIAIPQYTYDIYSISGEGTGGMFRPYRGDAGYVHDHLMRTKSTGGTGSVDLGGGGILHTGVEIINSSVYSQNTPWTGQNGMISRIGFQSRDTTFQPVYFRNPGEKTSNTVAYYQSIGDDSLIRVKLDGTKKGITATDKLLVYNGLNPVREIEVKDPIVKKQRDKRSQVISYLNAEEASQFGLDKLIQSYQENAIPVGDCKDIVASEPRIDENRKPHHLSEIDVLNGDGRRYVYGLPAYNLEQVDATFAVKKEEEPQNLAAGLVKYTPGTENNVNNPEGKDGYFSKEIIPAYAHSFLLTGIVSPDYVDIKGDGITEDDLGDAVKFNYTKVYGKANPYQWRTPYQSDRANYNEGLKSYNRDDKGTYIFGKKEVWYWHSVESKTMIALFKTSSDRKDVYSVKGENGGLDDTKGLRKLDRIELYVKSDLLKNGKNARPVKTVHFAYSYELCKGVAGDTNNGKLTLQSIWFTYNGNEKGKQNPYVFHYHDGADKKPLDLYNPKYNVKAYDRWGNYKDPQFNPGGLSNADYPYVYQDSATTARYAASWSLDEIQLPSGGRMKVTYESDDYSYVQEKRATVFTEIAGFGESETGTPVSSLYPVKGKPVDDYDFVFIKSKIPLESKNDVFTRYLEGNEYIGFKLAVKVPKDKWGSGYEFVPVYAKVKDYGLMTGSSMFWLKLERVGNESPLARAAIQFLRLNLPSKAYPSSELGDKVDLGDAVKMLASSFVEIQNSVNGFGSEAREKGWCRETELSKSFIRLNVPTYKKYGGGLRVKRIEIFDNWNAMTKRTNFPAGMKESVYGQEYSYTTTIKEGGQIRLISSGVASYEPMIGGEENPFRTPIAYAEKIAPMAPVNYMFSENPIGESFFSSASVGYSKVRIRTINDKVKSANGWEETEYFTTKDFPTLVTHTLLDDEAKRKYRPKLSSFLKINSVSFLTVSQGFKIELNDMNGRVKAQSVYAENDPVHPIHYTRNYYKVDNNQATVQHLNNNVWVVDSANGLINPNGIIGKDVEVMMDMREQYSLSTSKNVSPNIDLIPGFGIIPVIPFPSFLRPAQREETRFRSAATVKVVQRYGILDSVVVVDKGSVVSTKNLVYDGETGEVILSRTNNEFNDPVYNFSYPAHWAYNGMGMAYKNIDAVFGNLNLINGKLYYTNNQEFPTEQFFESGDEIQLKGVKQFISPFNCLQLVPPIFTLPLPSKIWALDAAKGKERAKGIYFIDENGRPLTGRVNYMRILRSGKRNMLDASAGSIVSMANPVREISPGQFKIVIDSTTKVFNASAATYKDLWAVENSLYQEDSCYTTTKDTLIPIKPTVRLIKRRYVAGNSSSDIISNNSNLLIAGTEVIKPQTDRHTYVYNTKALLQFDLNIPGNSTITSAYIEVYGREPRNPVPLWSQECVDRNVFGSCVRRNNDWNNEKLFYRDVTANHSSLFKRMTVAPGNSNNYDNYVGTNTNAVEVDYKSPVQVSIKQLMQDIVNNGNNGILFQLKNEPPFGSLKYDRIAFLCYAGNNENYQGWCREAKFQNGNYFLCNKGATGPTIWINAKIPKDTCVKVCRFNINDTSINPYRWGVLGNWRTDRAFTYYHDREQSDAAITQTDIRRDGLLKIFEPYWKFSSTGLSATTDTVKWVWNSAMSLYNRKGFEVENYDPLGRYNSGLYGYNQTLPVAVTQNSKYREALYDGFEDYAYRTNNCASCSSPKEFDFIKGNKGVEQSSAESHTGKYSMKVLAGSESRLTMPVVDTTTLKVSTALSVRVDSTPVYTQTVVGKGTGLTGTYNGYPVNKCSLGQIILTGTKTITQTTVEGPINMAWGSTAPVSGMCNLMYDVAWTGKIQVPYTDNYTLYGVSDGGMMVKINGVVVVNAMNANVEAGGPKISLEAAKLYDIQISYSHFTSSNAYVRFTWSREGDLIKSVVPRNFLYPASMTTVDTVGSVIRNIKYYCVKLNNPKPQNIIRPMFSPVQGSKLVVSAWVKIEGTDCNTAPALKDVIVVSFDSRGNNTTVSLEKTGVRIEGWQRYESVVSIPEDATKLYLSVKGTQSRTIYLDDIRVQPFNSNMKSYAYDPVNLRLMAELDENNYASFYEYDDDGTLIRVKKETERGIMTIKETRSALLKDSE
ncbi:PA14 domain-containing protein [Chitinophagaceae bacterium LB-8]|uniref:PA14 domain-containing protein n=1 Tax=Paraflavisolibacter caeni TaxID=2982496 RepID=A0A9X2XVF1_9BACT|nr:PA14 domain-containing protein [Paraflavisolibacter caeni]MCU7549881.1 PA14 domain-containing protein [Paraflavisolibacter caeni]